MSSLPSYPRVSNKLPCSLTAWSETRQVLDRWDTSSLLVAQDKRLVRADDHSLLTRELGVIHVTLGHYEPKHRGRRWVLFVNSLTASQLSVLA